MQPKKVVESRYAARDARDAAAHAAAPKFDPNDPAAAARAQEEAEIRMMQEQMGGGDGGAASSKLDEMSATAKSKADFEAFAAEVRA